jgi:aryl-alcohol dehydrogenase-like predicted oxidoreductase
MQYRKLGSTGWQVSEISFGAWGIGGGWGTVDDAACRPTWQMATTGRI